MRNDRGFTQDGETGAPRGRRSRVPLLVLACVAIVLAVLFAAGLIPRLMRDKTFAAAGDVARTAPIDVVAVRVVRAPAEVDVTLPGDIQALTEATIYARADGYIRKRYVDIGDRVRQGQLLVEIESPELDSQVQQARAAVLQAQSQLGQTQAALEQAKANLFLAQVTDRRNSALVKRGVLSLQEGDQSRSTLMARQADVSAAQANVKSANNNVAVSRASLKRLQDLQSFTYVRAPFAGVITRRNVDIGTLVSAGSSSSVRELFHIAQSGRLRVFVNVPQTEVASVHVGQSCALLVREFGSREFPATVVRTADALDPASRTLLVEVQTPNPRGELLPGTYAQVKFHLHREDPPLLIPSDALVVSAGGEQVALIRNGRVHFQKVKSGNDYGAQVEIAGGVEAGDLIVTGVTDEVREGRAVRVAARQ